MNLGHEVFGEPAKLKGKDECDDDDKDNEPPIGISARRLIALIKGLPGDAAIWRQDSYPPLEERVVQLIERNEIWHRAIFDALCHKDRIGVPTEITIKRPWQQQDNQDEPEVTEGQPVEHDVNAIAAWFAGGFM